MLLTLGIAIQKGARTPTNIQLCQRRGDRFVPVAAGGLYLLRNPENTMRSNEPPSSEHNEVYWPLQGGPEPLQFADMHREKGPHGLEAGRSGVVDKLGAGTGCLWLGRG